MVTGQQVCVFGGSGFIGRQLVARLANAGYDLTVPTRNRERCRSLLVMPNVRLRQVDGLDDATLATLLGGCTAAVNLIGILNGSERQFRAVHAELPARIAAACTNTGVGRYLHMSALNADAEHGASDYLRSKGAGEDTVHAVDGLAVTSFQPSVVFGPGDGFFNRFKTLLTLSPVLPLACPNARFAPVYSGDVVDAFTAALRDPASHGRRYQLCGPQVYTLRELVNYTAELSGRRRLVLGLSDGLSRRQAQVFDGAFRWLPLEPPFSLDNYRSMQVDSVCAADAPGLAELGITPTSVESVMPRLLAGRSERERYDTLRRFSRR